MTNALCKVKKLEDTYGGEAMGRHQENPPGRALESSSLIVSGLVGK